MLDIPPMIQMAIHCIHSLTIYSVQVNVMSNDIGAIVVLHILFNSDDNWKPVIQNASISKTNFGIIIVT
jgi:hypothetical protein